MRWWFVVLVLVCSCTFRKVEQAPSDGTTTTTDGAPGRDGGPVDGGTPDAPPTITCNPAACATAGNGTGTCDPVTNHCHIGTIGAGGLICPAGHFCDVTCGGTQGCRNGVVNCTAAVGCTVTCGTGGGTDTACQSGVQCPTNGPCTVKCNGGQTCQREAVVCGNGPCNVECLGTDACADKGVVCTASPKCDVKCKGLNACRTGAVSCGSGTCNVTCDGLNACQNLPAACAVMPMQCAFHCCGLNACQNGNLCANCTEDADCPP